MPQPSSEPEKYTIDEMMERLKARDATDKLPELVTRPDGSQAMKVKKRKRRTNQAVNEETKRNRRFQVAQIAGFVVLLMLVGLAVGIGILYANSSGYRDSLLSNLERSSGAKVGMQQFRMNPLGANASAATLAWPAGNALDTLELRAISAKISPSSFIGKSFGGDELVANSGKLVLKAPDDKDPARHLANPDGELPVKFARYSVPSLDVSLGLLGGLAKTEGSLFPSSASGQAEIRLRGGMLQLAGWPQMSLDRSYMKVRNSELQIQSMRFEVPVEAGSRKSGGSIDFSGKISPLAAEGSHTLSAELETFLLPYLIGNDIGRFFLGRVDHKDVPDSNFLNFDPHAPESAMLEVTVTNSLDSRIDLAGFHFLQMLAVALDDRWYEFPNFENDISMVVKRKGEMVEVSQIQLANRGRMAVRGSISSGEAGKISGKLKIGIPETSLEAAKDKRLGRIFGQTREGYRWLEIEIGGTSAIPEDNFKTIYLDTTSGGAPAPKEEKPQDSFEGLIEQE